MRYLALLLFLAGCVSTAQFDQGKLQCFHTVSTKLMGTAQVVSCERADGVVYVNSFPGVAAIDPIGKAAEAGAIAGALHNLPKALSTDSTIHIRP